MLRANGSARTMVPGTAGGTSGARMTLRLTDARLPAMNARVDQLLAEALSLPADERSALVVALLDSIEGSAERLGAL